MTKLLLACGIVLVSTMAQADWVYEDKGGGRICTLRKSYCFAEQPRIADWRNPYPGDVFRHVPGMAPLPKDQVYQWRRGWSAIRLANVPGEVWNEDDRVKGVMPDNAPKGYEWAQGENGDWKLKPEGPTTTMVVAMYREDGTKIDARMPDHWDVKKVKYTTKPNGESIRVYTAEQVAAAAKRRL